MAEPAPLYADHPDELDAGLEVVGHDDEPTALDQVVPRLFAGATSTTARAAAWSDYEWATWLPDVLRAAGVPVIVADGFATRGRPRTVGPFRPRGVMIHHDASAPGPSPSMAGFIGWQGRPDEGIPAPLGNAWVCRGCNGAHAVGTWHLLAAGRANHAGYGDGWGGIGRDAGNTACVGVEVDHTAGEKMPAALLDSLTTGSAAILGHLRSDPARWCCGHKEYAPGRKIDPAGVDMGAFRRDVAEALGARPFPGRDHFRIGQASEAVTRLERWLRRTGYLPACATPAPMFDGRTRAAVRRFQRETPALRGDADGIPGPLTWRLLQEAARAARRA